MRTYSLEIYNNTFKTRADIQKLLKDTLAPLESHLIRSGTRLDLGPIHSGAPSSVADMEGFMRLIWGIASDDSYGPEHPWWVRIRDGLINGTDPDHQDYFGEVGDYDQRLVEMAAVGYAMALRPEAIYEPLSDHEKMNLVTWLNQINDREAHNCNWKFFRVMVDIGFANLGIPFEKEKMEAYLSDLDRYYVKDGWYRDGDVEAAHVDYYGPFAMHFYGLFYVKYMPDRDHARAERYKERARLFAEEFIYWHSGEGDILPYGRSLTYRYAQVAFWSMLVTMDMDLPYSHSVIKGIIMRHFRWWHQWPIYDSKGLLTIGYTYPNQYMAENYNAPGSVYWAMKSFAILLLPSDHAFWTEEEAPIPDLVKMKKLDVPRMIITRNPSSNHVIAYNGGSHHTNAHTHVECKYEKFVYSNHFGFSVPKSHKSLDSGAFDAMLAVSEDGRYYRHREYNESVKVLEDRIIAVWHPYDDVTIETEIVCGHPWHRRIHRITSQRTLHVAEGGYAMAINDYMNSSKGDHLCTKDMAVASTGKDFVCVVNEVGYDGGSMIYTATNTNLIHPQTVIPTLTAVISPGKHELSAFISGDKVSLLSDATGKLDMKKLEDAINVRDIKKV